MPPMPIPSRIPSFLSWHHSAVRYSAVALGAAAIDWTSKAVVFAALGVGGSAPLTGPFSLHTTFNTASAGGVSVGPYTWHLNVLVTFVALLMITTIVRQLAAVDARSACALGLVTGGALGNMGSMLIGPFGVADFLALDLSPSTTIVMNVADLALWSGALLLLPVVARLIKAIRAERRQAGGVAPGSATVVLQS